MKYSISKLEPETLVLWISRSMLGLLFLLICRLIKLMSKISTIRVSFAYQKQNSQSEAGNFAQKQFTNFPILSLD